jgi:hypothetical protein
MCVPVSQLLAELFPEGKGQRAQEPSELPVLEDLGLWHFLWSPSSLGVAPVKPRLPGRDRDLQVGIGSDIFINQSWKGPK